MPRRDDVFRAFAGIDRDRNCPRAVRCRNAGGHAVARFDRRRERCFVPRAIRARHQFEAELVDARLRHSQTNQPAAVHCHEIDRVGCRHLRRDDEVAFVFAVLVVDKDIHAAVACFLNNLFDRDQRGAIIIGNEIGLEFTQRFACRVPADVVEIPQCIGMKPRRAGEPRPRNAAIGDMTAKFFDQGYTHPHR